MTEHAAQAAGAALTLGGLHLLAHHLHSNNVAAAHDLAAFAEPAKWQQVSQVSELSRGSLLGTTQGALCRVEVITQEEVTTTPHFDQFRWAMPDALCRTQLRWQQQLDLASCAPSLKIPSFQLSMR